MNSTLANFTNTTTSEPYYLQAKQGSILWFYLAYICLLCSYLNVNILIFRLFLIGASLMFIMGAILFGYIWLDSILFNVVMISINVYYSIPLIKQKIEIKLSDKEDVIFKNCFSKCMDKRTFKKILDSSSCYHIANNNFLVQQGNAYNGVYLVAYLHPSHSVNIYENNEKINVEASYFKWLGLIEYDIMRKAKKEDDKNSINWPISIKVENKSETFRNEHKYDCDYNSSTIEEFEQPLYVYFFKFEDLQKLYSGENGIFIRNSLHSIWLESLTHLILKLDKIIVLSMQNENKKNSHIESKNKNEINIELNHLATDNKKETEMDKDNNKEQENSDFSIHIQDHAKLD